jgi:hydrogenase maturation protease
VLVAGIGNVLRADDGFGPAVVQALEMEGALPPGARTVELGIGGIGLVHELLGGYDALIVVDAVDRGDRPGTLYVLEPDVPEPPARSGAELVTDMHEAVPARALAIARAIGALPPFVRIVGCQPAETEELSLELSPVARRAVPGAIAAVRALVEEAQAVLACRPA